MILVSACLAGCNCRYDGKIKEIKAISDLVAQGKAIAACPEQLGGRTTPRPQCEIVRQENGSSIVIDIHGVDITAEMVKGAESTLELALKYGVKKAILKSKSPSCGCGLVYDGSFTGKLTEGNGITTALLIDNGIAVLTEDSIEK